MANTWCGDIYDFHLAPQRAGRQVVIFTFFLRGLPRK